MAKDAAKILILGAGKIDTTVGEMLQETGDFVCR